ncbi:ABC transporter ATP-binding protein [Methylobacterium sp. ap11]|uniref:ABC transporter ATP-binding protein n=1 Tax=Methylobacterium sp. ap11 TaxID=1761799 RepID=UPI001AED004C|nr:ABC transporter ATP-binding protein [Methylobacterium sp. ap11]
MSLEMRLPSRWRARRMRILDDVDLTLAPGEIVGLVGESGSGKTTLGLTLVGRHSPTRGAIRLGGAPLAPGTPTQRRLQMVFQDPLGSFNPRRRVGDAVRLALDVHRIGLPSAREDIVAALFAQVGLASEHAVRFPHALSGGQLQRVAMARALATRPDFIVADEPVSKLDVSVRAQILNLVRRTNAETGVGLLFITHDLAAAQFLCHRIAVMYLGRIVEVGTPEVVLGRPRHPYTARLVAGAAYDGAAGTDPRLGSREACFYAPACRRRQPGCFEARPPLDETGLACFHPEGALAEGTLPGTASPERTLPKGHRDAVTARA